MRNMCNLQVSVLCRLEKLSSIEAECSAESTGISQFLHLCSSASNIYYVCKFRGFPGALQLKGLSRVFSNKQFKSINALVLSFLYTPTLTKSWK